MLVSVICGVNHIIETKVKAYLFRRLEQTDDASSSSSSTSESPESGDDPPDGLFFRHCIFDLSCSRWAAIGSSQSDHSDSSLSEQMSNPAAFFRTLDGFLSDEDTGTGFGGRNTGTAGLKSERKT